jgi:hypothetical protein
MLLISSPIERTPNAGPAAFIMVEKFFNLLACDNPYDVID